MVYIAIFGHIQIKRLGLATSTTRKETLSKHVELDWDNTQTVLATD